MLYKKRVTFCELRPVLYGQAARSGEVRRAPLRSLWLAAHLAAWRAQRDTGRPVVLIRYGETWLIRFLDHPAEYIEVRQYHPRSHRKGEDQ